MDLGQMYRDCRERIAMLVHDDVGALAVPATPLWSVHDVIAHVSGIAADVVAGNMEGVTTDPWTAAQVERNRGRSVADMVAEWAVNAPMIEGFLSSPAGASSNAAVIDLHTHEADLRHALGLSFAWPEDFIAWGGERMMSGFAEAVIAEGLAPVEVQVGPVESIRSRLGRRTRDEVRAYAWTLDPEPYLPLWFVFGSAEQSLGEVIDP